MQRAAVYAFPRHPWDIVIAVGAGLLLLALALAAAFAILPPALANAEAGVSDGTSSVELGGGATVVVPAGWVVGGATPDVSVRTPDGVLTVRLHAAQGTLDELYDSAVRDAAPLAETEDAGAAIEETMRSGARALHADLGESLVAGALVGGAAEQGVEFVAVVSTGFTMESHRAALAELLEGISP